LKLFNYKITMRNLALLALFLLLVRMLVGVGDSRWLGWVEA